ncbi:MAG: hypothetical protein ACRDTX_14170 [Pseudonocardiaceae bacterium]
MSEPWPDALFGVDGTEVSPPVPGRSGGGDRLDAPEFSSLPLPPIPKLTMTREEIAAALGEDLRGPADQARAAPSTASVPAPRVPQHGAPQPSAPHPSGPQSSVPQSSAPQSGASKPGAPQPGAARGDTVAMRPAPAGSPTAGSTSAGPHNRQTRPVIAAAPSPAQGTRRGLGVLRYGRRAAPRTRPRVQLRDARRRVSGPSRGLLTHTRSNGGAGAFFVITLITFAVLLYFIVSGIVAAFARLIP